MPAPAGNQFWKARSSYGTEKLFDSPETLWNAACEYFQWVEDNPLNEEKAFHFQGSVIKEPVVKMRAMTINGLCLFLDIDVQTLHNYGKKVGYEDYFEIVSKIKNTIYEQKFTGAAADLLNSNIIARDLGLADKKDLSSADGSMSPKGTASFYAEVEKEPSGE
ncbi:MAG: DNA-packaging protein [Leucothrix sp.]